MNSNLSYQVLSSTNDYTESLGKTIENIANTYSIGFKKTDLSFAQTLNGETEKYQTKDFAQGQLRKTGNQFDLALSGPGFFEVDLPTGQRAYTRAGRLQLNNEGELVTEDGYKVIPETEEESVTGTRTQNNELGVNIKVTSPKLTIPANNNIEVQEDGKISGIDPSTGEKNRFGKLSVVLFNNPQGLESIGKGYYIQTKASGTAQDLKKSDCSTQIKQGFIEQGNVHLATEFVKLSQIKNLLSAHLKVLKVLDKIQENLNYTIAKSV